MRLLRSALKIILCALCASAVNKHDAFAVQYAG
jgi:hypothetical protein